MGVKLGLGVAAPGGGGILAAGAGRCRFLGGVCAPVVGAAVVADPALCVAVLHQCFLFFRFCRHRVLCSLRLLLRRGRSCLCSLCGRSFGLFFRRFGQVFRFRAGLFAAHGQHRAHRGGHAVPRVAGYHRDLAAVQLFNACQILLLLRGAEADGGAVRTGAGGAPDAVHIGLRHLGQIVVEHMGKLADINAAGSDIGGHQHPGLAGLEILQRGDAGSLALVAVDGGGGDALLCQVLCDLIRAVLGAAEHQRIDHRRLQIFDEPRQQELLVALFHIVQALLDAVHGAGHRVHLDKGGVVQDAGSQLLDLGGHGGTEHQVLALGGQLCNDLFHVMDKAHVQHPVGLVQHKNFQCGQVDKALPDQIVQPSRAGDEDVHALFQRFHLRSLPHAAKDDGAAQFQVLAVGFKAFADLQGQLPGGGQDQRTDSALAAGRIGGEPVQHGQRKSRRLAGAGLGAAHQIPACQHRRDGRCLNGRGGLVARFLHSAQQRGGQIQFFKCHGSPIIL